MGKLRWFYTTAVVSSLKTNYWLVKEYNPKHNPEYCTGFPLSWSVLIVINDPMGNMLFKTWLMTDQSYWLAQLGAKVVGKNPHSPGLNIFRTGCLTILKLLFVRVPTSLYLNIYIYLYKKKERNTSKTSSYGRNSVYFLYFTLSKLYTYIYIYIHNKFLIIISQSIFIQLFWKLNIWLIFRFQTFWTTNIFSSFQEFLFIMQ